MSLILNIDTAVETASVCLAEEGIPILKEKNENQKDHAAWIHLAIEKLTREAGYEIKNIKSIAVSIGPGSYTGLRVGLSTAKGLCYGLNIPLIAIGTLEMMGFAGISNQSLHENSDFNEQVLFCPMIDARRMEVFTAVYDKNLTEIIPPQACILSENLFSDLLRTNKIYFFGNGSPKFKTLSNSANAVFKQINTDAEQLSGLSFTRFKEKKFADPAYISPLYVKEFYSPVRNPIDKFK